MKSSFLPFILFIFALVFFCYSSFKPKDNSIVSYPDNLNLNNHYFTSIFSNTPIKITDEKYILHVFASWCTTCLREHKMFHEISTQRKVKVIGLIWQDTKGNIDNMLREWGNPYYDIAFIDDKTLVNLGVTSLPANFLIEDRRVLIKISGPITKGVLKDAIYPAFK